MSKDTQVLTGYSAKLIEKLHKKLSTPKKILRSAGVIALSTCNTENQLKYIQRAMMSDSESESQIEQIIRLWDSLSVDARGDFFKGLDIPEDVEERENKPRVEKQLNSGVKSRKSVG